MNNSTPKNRTISDATAEELESRG
ncbi:PerC family transcriptional regulator, partial [Escherichia coli]